MYGPPPSFQPGAAYLFEWGPQGGWQEHHRLTGGEGAVAFGFAVLLDDASAWISSPIADRAAGAVYHFEPDEVETWGRTARLGPPAGQGQSLFGYSLTRAGSDLVVGAPGAQGAGAAYILRRDGSGSWTETQTLSRETRGLMGFFGGALTTTLFAFMMSRVDRRIGATHYTLLATLGVLGKSPGGWLSGVASETWGYAAVFFAAIVLSLLYLLLLVPLAREERAGG